MIKYYQLITFITVCHLIFIRCEMLAFELSVVLCFKLDKRGDLVQVQVLGELICNSKNLEAGIYNINNFTAPWTLPKPYIIPTSNLIHYPYGILWRIWSGRNAEDWNLECDKWYEKHIISHNGQELKYQEDPLFHGGPECAPLCNSNYAFVNVFGLQHTPTWMLCVSELNPDSNTCKAMVASSTPMATVNHVELYFDTCDSHISTSFKEDFVNLNEDHTDRTLDIISSGIAIRGTDTVKYVMLDDTGKPYTMMVESYWVPELKHRLVSAQDLYTEEGNPMFFQNKSRFEGGDIFDELMVNTKVKEYHRQPDFHNTTMQYNHRNNLPILSA